MNFQLDRKGPIQAPLTSLNFLSNLLVLKSRMHSRNIARLRWSFRVISASDFLLEMHLASGSKFELKKTTNSLRRPSQWQQYCDTWQFRSQRSYQPQGRLISKAMTTRKILARQKFNSTSFPFRLALRSRPESGELKYHTRTLRSSLKVKSSKTPKKLET